MARYCANCGTEVDDTAVFCPTCGQPIDEAAETEMPAAPAWPEPAREEPAAATPPSERGRDPVRGSGADARPDPDAVWAPTASGDDATRVERRPDLPPPPSAPAAVPPRATPPAQQRQRQGRSVDLPITTPVTLSGWLIGIGSLLAAIGVLIGLLDVVLNPIELLLLLALLAIAATVFFKERLPDIANLRLVILVVVLIGFGIALDRLGFGAAGAGELLLFLGTAAAAIGAILLELGHDQPLGGPGA